MYGNRKNRNPRSGQLLVDFVHIVICILIVVLAVLAFLDPEGHTMVYPVIFFLAAVLNGIEAAGRLRRDAKGKKRMAAGIAFSLVAVFLLALAVVSGASVWRQPGR